ncbi:hypothetical protein [Methylocapsa acidiphila]|uniref:hypothetical protein n=1 Tax=Methylocapsa acidiphila TaxID=133552 RepID=UPI00047B30FE|nr:hypothetical protein [Methylocapsa acidiphila]
MSGANEENRAPPDVNGAGERKAAERRRLAEALRANLGRRKAQNRGRRAEEADRRERLRDDPAKDADAEKS